MKNYLTTIALLAVFALGCDMSEVDPGGGYASSTTVSMTNSLTTEGGEQEIKDDGDSNTNTKSTASGPGNLVGIIKFSGTAPTQGIKIAVGAAPKDPSICAKDAAVLDESLVVDSASGGIKNVFIYLRKAPKGPKWEPKEIPIFDQKNCVFLSHALIVPAGVPFVAKNSDSAAHNANFGGLRLNSPFNLTIAASDTAQAVIPSAESAPARVNCDLHSWMDAWVLPLDHPYAAITNEKGEFTIKDIPAGKYDFRVWHEKSSKGKLGEGGFLTTAKKFQVQAGEDNRMDLSFGSDDFH